MLSHTVGWEEKPDTMKGRLLYVGLEAYLPFIHEEALSLPSTLEGWGDNSVSKHLRHQRKYLS